MLEKLDGGLRFEGADALLPYLYDKPVTLGAWAGPDTMTCLIEPRSLFDDATHAYEEIEARAKGTKIPAAGLYAGPTALDFGGGVRATYVSIMRVGGTIDVELPVKRVEVAGHPDKLFGRLVSLVEGGNTVALCAPEPRARHDI